MSKYVFLGAFIGYDSSLANNSSRVAAPQNLITSNINAMSRIQDS